MVLCLFDDNAYCPILNQHCYEQIDMVVSGDIINKW